MNPPPPSKEKHKNARIKGDSCDGSGAHRNLLPTLLTFLQPKTGAKTSNLICLSTDSLSGSWVQFPAHTWCLTSIYNCSLMGSDNLFWCTGGCTGRQNILIHKIHKSLKNKAPNSRNSEGEKVRKGEKLCCSWGFKLFLPVFNLTTGCFLRGSKHTQKKYKKQWKKTHTLAAYQIWNTSCTLSSLKQVDCGVNSEKGGAGQPKEAALLRDPLRVQLFLLHAETPLAAPSVSMNFFISTAGGSQRSHSSFNELSQI